MPVPSPCTLQEWLSGRLPAYSGATVPVFDRLPSRSAIAALHKRRRALLFAGNRTRVKRLLCTLLTLVLFGAAPKPRIVTLMPSFAEDACAIGAGAQLAGVSAYSGDISCAKGVPEVNNFSSLNAERIVQLHPDAVVALPSQRGMTAPLEHAHVHVVYVSDDSFADIFTGIAAIGALTRRQAQAARLVASLHSQTKALQAKAHYRRTPRVLFVEQALPLWTIGPRSYITTLIELAGGQIVTGDLPAAYGQYSDEAVLRSDPDAIVATADAHLRDVLNRQPWRSLRAVREHHVFVIADSNVLARPGPRCVEGLQWLIARFSSL